MTTKQLDFVSIPESQHDQDDDLGKVSLGKVGKAFGVLNGGINAFNGVYTIGKKFGLWDTDSEGVDVVSTSESQFDQDDDLGKIPFGKVGKAFGVLNGGIDAFNGVYGIGEKFGLWDTDSEGVDVVSTSESQFDQDDDLGKVSFGGSLWGADSEGAEVSDGNTVNGFAQQSTSAFDSLTGSELPPGTSSEVSASETNDDLGVLPLLKLGAKVYLWGRAGGAWDVDSESAELDADTIGSPSWFQMHHDDGIMDGYLDVGADASGFDSFLLQSGSDLIAPITEPFADATAITDLVTGKSGIQESGMDGLVAAGPLDAVQVDQPRNNDF